MVFFSGCLAGVEQKIENTKTVDILEKVRQQNSEIYLTLLEGGFKDSVVDVTRERTLVRFKVPIGLDEATSVFYVLGAVGTVAPESDLVVLQLVEGRDIVKEMTIESSLVDRVVRGSSDSSLIVFNLDVE